MKRKIISVISALLLVLPGAAAVAESSVQVKIDGTLCDFNPGAMIVSDRTVVPMRAVFEALGAQVSWNDITKEVSATKEGKEIKLTVGSNVAYVGGAQVALDCPPQIYESRTMVPLRFISESLGAQVEWNGDEMMVSITTQLSGTEYNIAEVSASTDDGNVAENAIDVSYETRWSAQGAYCTLTLTLEESVPIGYVGIAWYSGNERTEMFDIELSEDGETFTKAFSGQSTQGLNMYPYSCGGKSGKYVRIVCKGNSDNLWNSITEIKVYAPTADGTMPVENAGLDGSTVSMVTDDIMKEIVNIDGTLFDTDLLDWIAGMYDVESGGFYYAESARKNEGFGVDIESTSQAVTALKTLGVWDESKMPDGFIQKIVSYAQSCQNPDDGYFYEPQFGTDVSVVKKERNNSQALMLISLGGEPLYPTVSERLAQAAKMTADAPEQNIFESRETYEKWLHNLFETAPDYYTAGSNIAAANTSIERAGFMDITRDYITSLQNQETGLWGDGLDYLALNGAMKCSTVYQDGHPFPNIDKYLKSYIYIVKNCEPEHIAAVWNPLALLVKVIASYGNTLSDDLKKEIQSSLAEILSITRENVLKYRQSDRGYSWFTSGSAATSNNEKMCLGLAEGDMNAAMLAIYVRTSAYSVAGLKKDEYPIFTDEEIAQFWSKIAQAKPNVKNVKPLGINENFENIDGETGLPKWSSEYHSEGASFAAAIDPYGVIRQNHVMKFIASGKGNSRLLMLCKQPESYKTATLELDVCMDNYVGNRDTLFYNAIGSDKNEVVSWCIGAENGMAKLFLRQGSDGGFVKIGEFPQDEWFKIKIEYTPSDSGSVSCYVDGTRISLSNLYYTDGVANAQPRTMIDGIYFASFGSAAATIYYDNVKLTFE